MEGFEGLVLWVERVWGISKCFLADSSSQSIKASHLNPRICYGSGSGHEAALSHT